MMISKMLEGIKIKLKSNKGFTMQDLVVAVMAVVLLTGTIASAYLAVYEVQADTKVDSMATLYLVQIVERIDKIGYDEITDEKAQSVITQMRNDFKIPNRYNILLEVVPNTYEQDVMKTVKVSLNYTFNDKERSIVIERLKVKEL